MRGQSEIIGVALLIGLVIAGTIAIVTIGGDSLTRSHEHAQLERTEHAMTALDSRGVRVALGRSDVQTVDLGDSGDGSYTVDPDAGWISIRHDNYTVTGGASEPIYNGTLGAVIYRNGETTIAYQGGGVWRSSGGGSIMVSPPEFHYRDETLTLPLISVAGSGHVSGTGQALVRTGSDSRVFPSVATYASGKPYQNPVRHGDVLVTIHSAYYEAWADYARSRTDGTVRVDHANQTAEISLTAGGTVGNFDMPEEGNPIEIRGLTEAHGIENFTVVLAPDDLDNARFNNLQWSMYVEKGNQRLEYHLRDAPGEPDADGACNPERVSLTVFYSDTNGNPYEGWHNSSAFTTTCVDRDDDGVDDEVQLVANLTGPTQLELMDLSSSDLEHFNPSGDTHKPSVTFDEHDDSVAWEPKTFSDAGDDDTTAWNLTNHYLSHLGPDFDLVVDDKESDTINEDASWGTLVYDAKGQVTYMYVIENNVTVDVTT